MNQIIFPNLQVITLRRKPERYERCRAMLDSEGIAHTRFYGIDAPALGLMHYHTYDYDNPGTGFVMGQGNLGTLLSIYTVFRCAEAAGWEEFAIMEDDCVLRRSWRGRYFEARENLPADWQVLFLGHCCASGKESRHTRGNIWEVKYPMCAHLQMFRRSALPALIGAIDDISLDQIRGGVGERTVRGKHGITGIYAPMDIALAFHAFHHLRVYTVIPRIADQLDTDIPE